MKKIVFLTLFFMPGLNLPAQQKIRFSTDNSLGLLVGASAQAPVIQTINGVSFGRWFTGIGTGLDWYHTRSIPLFFHTARYFPLQERRKLVFSSGIGLNFPWIGQGMRNGGWGSTDWKYDTGLYWNAGFGYRFPVGKNRDGFLLQLGFNQKVHKEEVTVVYPCFVPPCPESREAFRYTLRSLALRFGWGF